MWTGSINSVKNNAGHALPKGASERSGSTGQEKGASSRERRPNKPETGAWLPPRCRSGPPRSPSPFGSAYGLSVHVGWLMTTNIAPAQTKDVLDRTRPIRKFPLVQGTWYRLRSPHLEQAAAQVRAADGLCSSAHPARLRQGSISSEPRRPAMFKSALTLFAVVAGVAKRLPLFQPASIERELEQTLCLIRCCRQQREKAVARRPVSAT